MYPWMNFWCVELGGSLLCPSESALDGPCVMMVVDVVVNATFLVSFVWCSTLTMVSAGGKDPISRSGRMRLGHVRDSA